MNLLIPESEFLSQIVKYTEEAIILVDVNFCVQYMNNTAKRMLDVENEDYENKHFYNDLELVRVAQGRSMSIIEEVLQTGKAIRHVFRQTKNDRHVSMNVIPLFEDGEQKAILVTALDVTDYMEMEKELDLAFALTLPNSKIEYKLKSTVEYQDIYDRDSGQITITGIIEDGGYRHVVNCLKIFSILSARGVTKVIGINKDELVQAFIFHDIGKSQPILHVGDVVNPKEAFEDGRLHAYRGAEIAKAFYHQSDIVVDIIQYHHHSEHELPESFSWRLLPMFRLFQLVDGLSAAITRGGVKVEFSVFDCKVQVTETNHRPQYNGTWQIDLYTGERKRLL